MEDSHTLIEYISSTSCPSHCWIHVAFVPAAWGIYCGALSGGTEHEHRASSTNNPKHTRLSSIGTIHIHINKIYNTHELYMYVRKITVEGNNLCHGRRLGPQPKLRWIREHERKFPSLQAARKGKSLTKNKLKKLTSFWFWAIELISNGHLGGRL